MTMLFRMRHSNGMRELAFKTIHRLTATTLLAVVLALPGTANGQTTPAPAMSLEETLNWLKTYLPTATGARMKTSDGGYIEWTTSLDFVSGCRIQLDITVERDRKGKRRHAGALFSRETFDLADIDPATVRVEPDQTLFRVMFETRGRVRAIHSTDAANNTLSDDPGDALEGFGDSASAEKALEAFRRAVQLCARP